MGFDWDRNRLGEEIKVVAAEEAFVLNAGAGNKRNLAPYHSRGTVGQVDRSVITKRPDFRQCSMR